MCMYGYMYKHPWSIKYVAISNDEKIGKLPFLHFEAAWNNVINLLLFWRIIKIFSHHRSISKATRHKTNHHPDIEKNILKGVKNKAKKAITFQIGMQR